MVTRTVFFSISLILIFIFFSFPLISIANSCDINDVIFNPSYDSIDQSSWFKRGQSTFTVEIVANGNCSGEILPEVSLTNTTGVNNDVEALNDVKMKFDSGSNKIKLYFEAGEEGCTAVFGKSDCQLELFIKSPAAKDGYWSGGNKALFQKGYSKGKLKYECDKRFVTCNTSIVFKLLKIEGGKIN